MCPSGARTVMDAAAAARSAIIVLTHVCRDWLDELAPCQGFQSLFQWPFSVQSKTTCMCKGIRLSQ